MRRFIPLHAGILFAALPLLTLSCGERKPTEVATLAGEVTAVPVYDAFYSPIDILTVQREILVDSRATQIEWDVAGSGNFVLMSGRYGGGGGEYYANVRAQWTRDQFERPVAIQFLIQWPDLSENRLDHPIVNDSIDVFDNNGVRTFDCTTDDRIIRPTSWHRGDDLEDQVVIEIFQNSAGAYPADNWRWGAGTTDPATPVSPVDFVGADEDSTEIFKHPQAGFSEDRYDYGAGPTRDLAWDPLEATGPGPLTYEPNYVEYPNGVLPLSIAGKGTRDSRLNRSKPTAYTVWRYVKFPLTQCTLENPVRLDDAAQRDKSWNPGDYVPGWIIGLPIDKSAIIDTVRLAPFSSADVLSRGAWDGGKWSLEIRRRLSTGFSDDILLEPGRTYGIRLSIRDGQTKRESKSALIPLILRPAPPR